VFFAEINRSGLGKTKHRATKKVFQWRLSGRALLPATVLTECVVINRGECEQPYPMPQDERPNSDIGRSDGADGIISNV